MTYHNMAMKMDKGKGAVIKMGSNEIQMSKTEGTGLFACFSLTRRVAYHPGPHG